MQDHEGQEHAHLMAENLALLRRVVRFIAGIGIIVLKGQDNAAGLTGIATQHYAEATFYAVAIIGIGIGLFMLASIGD